MTAKRTSRHIQKSGDDGFLVALQIRGQTHAMQDGREVVLEPGDFSLFDSARPYRVQFRGPSFEHLVLQLPRRELITAGVDAAHDTGRRIRAATSIGRLAFSYIVNLSNFGDAGEREERTNLGQIAIELLGSSLRSQTSGGGAGDLISQIKRYALRRLGDPDLSPRAVAAEFPISVRHLHRLFAGEGLTFAAWARENRLRRCYDELADPSSSHLSVGEIRRLHGFVDPAVFSRCFRSRFGLTPTERRSQLAAAVDLRDR